MKRKVFCVFLLVLVSHRGVQGGVQLIQHDESQKDWVKLRCDEFKWGGLWGGRDYLISLVVSKTHSWWVKGQIKENPIEWNLFD